MSQLSPSPYPLPPKGGEGKGEGGGTGYEEVIMSQSGSLDRPIHKLRSIGQSVWYDNIQRSLITSGRLARMMSEDGLAGMTSNPTIFEKAINGSTDYDEDLKSLTSRQAPLQEILDNLTVKDIQLACDAFHPLFDSTHGVDGRVSIEVTPKFGRDTTATIQEAHRLGALVNRPNVMVKVPATVEGLAAVEVLTAEGLNINITLIFSVERYAAVMNAYLRGLEARAAKGQALGTVHSVASFFVSRINVSANTLLDQQIAATSSAAERERLQELRWKIAVANSKRAYQRFRKVFTSERFARLAAQGAHVQRVLWASTGVKDPSLPPTYYLEALMGPDTVNTLPPETYETFRTSGVVAPTLEVGVEEAERQLVSLEQAGISLATICEDLEVKGLKSFADSWEKLSQSLAAKRDQLQLATR